MAYSNIMHGTVDTLLDSGTVKGNLKILSTEFILQHAGKNAYLEARFLRGSVRAIAAGICLDFASIMRDFSGTGMKLK